MKTLKTIKFSLLFGAVLSLGFVSCKEDIDDSAFAIKTEQMVADYLQENSQFSEISAIFEKVPLGTKKDASPIMSALSARGNYTVFAPTNDAVLQFAKTMGHSSVSELTDEELKLIAYSCIIDNGTDNAYESPDFPTDGGAFTLPDLNDRLITCQEEVDAETQESYFCLNGTSRLTKTDIELGNGYVHIVGDNAIAPSNKSVADLIKAADNMKVMSMLLEKTGWDLKVSTDSASLDLEYEAVEREERLTISGMSSFAIAQHRYLGYTAFVETDDVYAAKLGIDVSNLDDALEKITTLAEETYGTDAKGDYTNLDNAVNRFVAYHLMKGKVAYNKLIRHFNEYGYQYVDAKNPQTTNLAIDVWDYYTMCGSRPGLLKVVQEGDLPEVTEHNIYLNRICTYNNENYATESVVREGIKVDAYNGEFDNAAKNGYYFPINDILIDDISTQNALSSERIRIDVSTMLPELSSNNVRGGVYTHFPNGYFENITGENADSKLLYLNSGAVGGAGWRDYQGDEFMACGVFDFVMKLPPVPKTGTYELRFGVSHNSLRGMAQLYLGDDPNNLTPAGLPYDMRQSVINNDNIGCVQDVSDEAVNAENDKNMRNHGFMKAPRYITVCDGEGKNQLRSLHVAEMAIRRIIVEQTFEKGKSYYIRFKSALEKSDAQFFLDYFEFCPKMVYNGTKAEDQW